MLTYLKKINDNGCAAKTNHDRCVNVRATVRACVRSCNCDASMTTNSPVPVTRGINLERHTCRVVEPQNKYSRVRVGEVHNGQSGLQVGHDTWRDSARLELIGD